MARCSIQIGDTGSHVDREKLLLTLFGVLLGWVVKTMTDFYTLQRDSWPALDSLEFELITVLSLRDRVIELTEQATAHESAGNPDRATTTKEMAGKLINR